MILSENTIRAVREASISEVLGHYMSLKQRGTSYLGLCPFHNEKSPSFTVKESKGLYKCFGCGVGGDMLHFVMEHDKLEFIPAVEKVASLVGIPCEYEEVPDKEKYEAEKAIKDQMKATVRYAVDHYHANLHALDDTHPVMQYLVERNITRDVINDWKLGWATEEWRHLTPELINKQWYEPATKLGLIKRSQSGDNNYDGYRSRITIPIMNRHGEPIGMGGRFFQLDPADKDKSIPKYINPPENDLYHKKMVLFGLSHAEKGIAKLGFSWLVEGYFDVISMHANNDENTVATCGTALTTEQAIILKNYTSHVVVLRDGDEAGRNATVKDLYILLRAGFKVDVGLLPDGEDPDEYSRKLMKGMVPGVVDFYDGVMWQVNVLLKHVNNDEFKMGKAQEAILKLLLTIDNEIIRSSYFDSITKKYKWRKTDLQKRLDAMIEKQKEDEDDDGTSNLDKLPKWMDKEEFLRQGYCSVNNNKRTGYYTFGSSGQTEITNFVINPLFHIYAGKESRHMVQIDNGRKRAVLDIESKALVSPDLLQQYVVCEGPFIIYGSKAQMLRIATNLLANFPLCMEVKFLGWQPAGFFAFVDKVYIPGKGLVDLDQWGILKHKDDNYLVPAASAAYKDLQKTGEDPYEQDRPFKYVTTELTFSTWATRMNRVYKEKGPVGIAYVILTVFRDIIFEVDSNCPHLYGFGEKSSGKSQWMYSIMSVFFVDRQAFNLNSGTDFAFFSYMQRFVNCPAFLNEFEDKVIKPEWFQSIKGVFDGEGRQRGVMGSKNRTEIMKVRSTLLLLGQFLCTMDDNSVVSRSIIEGFSVQNITEDDKVQYDQLKVLEKAGLSSILIELLELRAHFKEVYRTTFNDILSKWRRAITGEFNQRIMQNWCHLAACWRIIGEKIALPITVAEFEAYCKQKGMHWCSFIRTTDTLSEFWNTLSFLVDQGLIIEGWDYKIQEVLQIKIRKGTHDEYNHTFDEPTKVIYIRLNNVHKHYQQAFRSRTGKEGMTMENLLHYFGARPYFLGNSKQSRFKRWVTKTENVVRKGGLTSIVMPETNKHEEQVLTSSAVFLYDLLNLDLERSIAEPDPGETSSTDQEGFKPVEGAEFDSKNASEPEQANIPFR